MGGPRRSGQRNRSLVDESDGIATGLADDCKPMCRAIFDVFDGSLSWVLAVTHHSAVRHARGLPFAVTVTFATKHEQVVTRQV
jgi:hypothetical protein